MITLNGAPINIPTFPDKTKQVWKLSNDQLNYVKDNSDIVVVWNFEDSSEVFSVVQLAWLITHEKMMVVSDADEMLKTKLILDCPYLPYGRQDKDISNELTFALFPFAGIVGTYFHEFRTLDAHSEVMKSFVVDVPGGICRKWENESPKEYILYARDNSNSNRICFPDAGAKTRYHKMGLGDEYPIVMNKVRDQSTGEITGLEIVEGKAFKGDNVLICDDIADGSRTFIETSKVLIAKGARSVNLYVTHGIFSKGLDIVHESGIDKIYTYKGLISSK
jgi:phosphoribosylpyrophosphate synthetase